MRERRANDDGRRSGRHGAWWLGMLVSPTLVCSNWTTGHEKVGFGLLVPPQRRFVI